MISLRRIAPALLLLIAVTLLVAYQQVRADPPPFSLDWWSIDGGGATFLAGGSYSLGSTAGQPDAGVLTGNGFTLQGGFWNDTFAHYTFTAPVTLRSFTAGW